MSDEELLQCFGSCCVCGQPAREDTDSFIDCFVCGQRVCKRCPCDCDEQEQAQSSLFRMKFYAGTLNQRRQYVASVPAREREECEAVRQARKERAA